MYTYTKHIHVHCKNSPVDCVNGEQIDQFVCSETCISFECGEPTSQHGILREPRACGMQIIAPNYNVNTTFNVQVIFSYVDNVMRMSAITDETHLLPKIHCDADI